jgi:subfamily B ATP-binding cassette protein MsbA
VILLVLANLLAGLIESVGILLFIPFLAGLSLPEATDSGVARFIEGAFASADWEPSLPHLLLLLMAVFAVKGVIVYAISLYRTHLISRVSLRIREEIIERYALLDYRYVQEKSAGFFGNLLVTEASRACVAIDYYCAALSALATAALLFATATLLNARLALFTAGAAGVFMLLFRITFERARAHSVNLTALSTRMNEFAIEALHAFKYLKATSRVGVLQARLHATTQRSRDVLNSLGRMDALHAALREPFLVIFIAAIFYWFVIVEGTSATVIVASILLFYRCMVELFHFRVHWQGVANQAGGIEAVVAQSREFDRHAESSGERGPVPLTSELELRDVAYTYDGTPVLRGADIVVPRNATVALVGISGAGKTTLVDLMTGVLRPVAGTVRVDGRDLRELDGFDWRSRIGYVAQETVVFSTTVAHNISMRWEGGEDPDALEAVRRAARQSACDEFIERLPQGYGTQVGERGVKLSGGQRQRLAIARELFREPQLLILDEATSSLDSLSETLIQESVDRLKGTMTIVVVSHRLSTIRNADRIYVIDEGRVVEEGSFAELSESKGSAFQRMCELQRLI